MLFNQEVREEEKEKKAGKKKIKEKEWNRKNDKVHIGCGLYVL
jgi:hypothetical protein